jgi:nitrogen fixation/metabolism regulation signal transduction histidine kinase
MAPRFHYLPVGMRGRLLLIVIALVPMAALLLGLGEVAIAIFATVSVLVGWLGTVFSVIRPAGSLIAATCRIAEGDLDARAGIADCAGTMGDLGVAFDRMAELLVAEHARRAGIEASLRRSVAHHEDVLASLHEVVFQTDVEGRWLPLSPAWVEITGFSVAEALGKPFTELVMAGSRRGDQTGAVRPDLHGLSDAGARRLRRVGADSRARAIGPAHADRGVDGERARE